MDQESLTRRISNLENELFEYQYNMGLLLIEKKEWASKFEEIKEASVEVADTLKREQAAHSIVMSEVEKREENLKKALGVERQCVLELEKALREIRSEYAEIKFNADSKLAEANALIASVEEKSWEVEAKFHSADTKLAEVSRKSSDIERKLHELDAQETLLRREGFSLATERETHEAALSKKRVDMREWEQKLQDLEQRLADARQLLNQREEMANENDKIMKKKLNDLEELQRKIEMANSSLKCKEDDTGIRLANLAIKEKEANGTQKSLEVKETKLLELEEKLNAREKLEIQKLLDEHNALLVKKQHEFELEVEHKRELHDEQLKDKVVEVEKKEAEIMHMVEKVKKREQAIENKLEKVKQKEMDYESKYKILKDKEKLLKLEEKSLEKDMKQMLAEKEGLLSMNAELENLRAGIEEHRISLNQEREQLKLTEDERLEHARLRSELKQEIDKWRLQSERIMKEADELKQEKENFEKEWEELDDKRVKMKRELEDALYQKKCLEKLRHSEEEKLNNDKQETQQYIKRELESLKLEKDNFTANMELEKSMLAEKFHCEKSELLHDFELQKQELETEMQRKQEEMESSLLEREKTFEQERDAELDKIRYLREKTTREVEEMKLERLGMDKEKLEILHIKKTAEAQQLAMQNDIEELVGLSQKVKAEREHFIRERERFITFAQKQKSCNICGDTICEFMLCDLQPPKELKTLESPPLPRVVDNNLEAVEGFSERLNDGLSTLLVNTGSPAAGGSGTISWLRKCSSKIFKFSAGKKLELDSAQDAPEGSSLLGKQINTNAPKTSASSEKGPEQSLQVASDSFDSQRIESGIKELEALSVDQNVFAISDNTQNSFLKISRRRTKGGKPKASKTLAGKAATASAKDILEQPTAEHDNLYVNGVAENSTYTDEENNSESGFVELPKNRRKRNHARVSQKSGSDNYSEDRVKDGDRQRRQKVDASQQSFVEKRYNLRRPQKSVALVANGSLTKTRKGKKKQMDGHVSKKTQMPGFETNPSENAEIDRIPQLDIHEPGAASTVPSHEPGAAVTVPSGNSMEAVRSTKDASDFSADNPERFNNVQDTHSGHVDSANSPMTDMALSQEANGVAGTRDYSDDSDNDGDGNEVNPGEVSIRKKFWTFITT